MKRITLDEKAAALLRAAHGTVGLKTHMGSRLGEFYPAGIPVPPEPPKSEQPPPDHPPTKPSDPA